MLHYVHCAVCALCALVQQYVLAKINAGLAPICLCLFMHSCVPSMWMWPYRCQFKFGNYADFDVTFVWCTLCMCWRKQQQVLHRFVCLFIFWLVCLFICSFVCVCLFVCVVNVNVAVSLPLLKFGNYAFRLALQWQTLLQSFNRVKTKRIATRSNILAIQEKRGGSSYVKICSQWGIGQFFCKYCIYCL